MVLERCVVTQSCMNMEYRRGLSMQPCGEPVLRVRMDDVVVPICTALSLSVKVQKPITEDGV